MLKFRPDTHAACLAAKMRTRDYTKYRAPEQKDHRDRYLLVVAMVAEARDRAMDVGMKRALESFRGLYAISGKRTGAIDLMACCLRILIHATLENVR